MKTLNRISKHYGAILIFGPFCLAVLLHLLFGVSLKPMLIVGVVLLVVGCLFFIFHGDPLLILLIASAGFICATGLMYVCNALIH